MEFIRQRLSIKMGDLRLQHRAGGTELGLRYPSTGILQENGSLQREIVVKTSTLSESSLQKEKLQNKQVLPTQPTESFKKNVEKSKTALGSKHTVDSSTPEPQKYYYSEIYEVNNEGHKTGSTIAFERIEIEKNQGLLGLKTLKRTEELHKKTGKLYGARYIGVFENNSKALEYTKVKNKKNE